MPPEGEGEYVITLSRSETLQLTGLLGRTFGGNDVSEIYWQLSDLLDSDGREWLDSSDFLVGDQMRISGGASGCR